MPAPSITRLSVLFNTFEYAAFLAVALVVYWRLGHRWQNRWLLLLSYAFYAAWDVRFVGLLALSTTVDYLVARRLQVTTGPVRRRLVTASIVVNLTLLGFFKYFGFFVDSAGSLLAAAGLEPNLPLLSIVLPVGISFYTFQSMSYTIDVYRGEFEARRSFTDVALYVSFFPQLVAGPIERAGHLLPQLERPRTRPDVEGVWSALVLFGQGLFKKVVLADALGAFFAGIARPVGDEPVLTLGLGLVMFWVRFWADFSGYTDMARASARLLGVDLRRNFEAPLIARNPSQLWRRWHMSLSEWVRDYVFIPLGGSRGSSSRTALNLLVTMFVMGLWHGASWNFGIWGLAMGIALVLHRWRRRVRPVATPSSFGHVWRSVGTYLFMAAGMVLFATPDLRSAAAYVGTMARFLPGRPAVDTLLLMAGVLSLAIAFNVQQERTGRDVLGFGATAGRIRHGVAVGFAVVAVVVFSSGEPAPFVYFQF